MTIEWKKVDMEEVGKKLLLVRKSKEMTQDEFVEDCNIKRRAYSKYEKGLQKPKANEENFLKLLSKHDLNVEWILYDKNISTKSINTASLYLEVTTERGTFKISFADKPLDYLEKALELYRVSV